MWRTSVLLISALLLFVCACVCLAQDPLFDENPIELMSNLIPVIHDPYEQQFQQQQQQSSNPPFLAGAENTNSATPNYDEFTDDYGMGTSGPGSGSNQIPGKKAISGWGRGRGPATRRGGRRFGPVSVVPSMPRSDNRNRYMDDLLLPIRSTKCDRRIRVINGATRIRDKGALVRFQCSYGFHMLGVSVAVCVRGQWSDPPPTCVRDGCRKLPIPLQGSLRQLYGGGVALFSCNYGYELEGQRILTCDGQKWNGSAPVCREIPPITIAPPSTTFPTLPELFTTEASNNVGADKSPNAGITSTTLPSPYPTIDSDPAMDIAPSHGRGWPDADDPDFVLIPSSAPSEGSEDSGRTESNQSAVQTRTDSGDIDGKNNTTYTTTDMPDRPDMPPSIDMDPMDPILSVEATTLAPAVNVAPGPGPGPSQREPMTSTSTASTTSKAVTSSSISTSTLPTTTKKMSPLAPATAPVPAPLPVPVTRRTTLRPIRTSRPSVFKFPKWSWLKNSTSATPMTVNFSTTRFPLALPAPADQNPLPYNPVPHYMSPLTVSPPRFELVPAIHPEKLGEGDGDSASVATETADSGRILVTVGIVLIVLGALTVTGGLVTYCWRRNVGIARARSHDIDGRTLNMSQGSNEDVVWSENRDSRL